MSDSTGQRQAGEGAQPARNKIKTERKTVRGTGRKPGLPSWQGRRPRRVPAPPGARPREMQCEEGGRQTAAGRSPRRGPGAAACSRRCLCGGRSGGRRRRRGSQKRGEVGNGQRKTEREKENDEQWIGIGCCNAIRRARQFSPGRMETLRHQGARSCNVLRHALGGEECREETRAGEGSVTNREKAEKGKERREREGHPQMYTHTDRETDTGTDTDTQQQLTGMSSLQKVRKAARSQGYPLATAAPPMVVNCCCRARQRQIHMSLAVTGPTHANHGFTKVNDACGSLVQYTAHVLAQLVAECRGCAAFFRSVSPCWTWHQGWGHQEVSSASP